MLDDAIERSQQIFSAIGATWYEQKKMWRFAGGGRLRFRPLERAQDAEKYQGQNISDACVEEAGNYADPAPIDRLNGVLRSVLGVPTQLLLTGNPGGPGQHWIKARYIDPAQNGMRILSRRLPNGAEHRYVFIPSKVQNNRLLLHNDPDYINRLYLVGSAELVKAWLEGDWNAIEGAYFGEWNTALHVLEPFSVPTHWARLHSFDWGSAKPFSWGEWAIASEDYRTQGRTIPRGALIRVNEWYGAQRDELGNTVPDVGLKLTAEKVSEGIIARLSKRSLLGVADPAIFTEDGGPSIAERMRPVIFKAADNKRIGKNGAMGGWDMVRERLVGINPVRDESGAVVKVTQPMIYFFSTCRDSIRTIPALQHDPNKPEDLDTSSEDHAADEIRYACMSRPWTAPSASREAPRDRWEEAFDEPESGNWKTV